MYPKYKKALSPDGHITTLICENSADQIVLLQPVAAAHKEGYEVHITQVNSTDELKARIGGAVFDCPPEEYNETLFNVWGFDGSNIYRANSTESAVNNDNIGNDATQNHGAQSQSEPQNDNTEPNISPGSITEGATERGQTGNEDVGSPIGSNGSGSPDVPSVEGAETSGTEPDAIAGTSDGNVGNADQPSADASTEGDGTQNAA